MANKIDFKSLKKGDDVTVTVLDNGKKETISGKITNISQTKKILHIENDESKYECKFSEIKDILFRNGQIEISERGRKIIIAIIIICLFAFSKFYKTNQNRTIQEEKARIEIEKKKEKENALITFYKECVRTKKFADFSEKEIRDTCECIANDFYRWLGHERFYKTLNASLRSHYESNFDYHFVHNVRTDYSETRFLYDYIHSCENLTAMKSAFSSE